MGKNKNRPKKIPPQAQANLEQLIDKLLYCCSIKHSSFKEEWSNFLEINSILTDINDIEKDITTVPKDRYDNLEVFLSWCKDNGAFFEGIKVDRVCGKDLGLVAENDLKEGSLYLKVPRKLMLSTENASARLGNLARKDVVLQSMPNVLLAFLLLIESFETDSFYKPYISVLPSSYSTILYFTQEELEELQGSPTLAEAVNLRRSIARQYAYLYKLFQANADLKSLKAKKHFTYNTYRWAVSCVMTRQNAIPASHSKATDQAKSLSLVPLWDLCNHEPGMFSTDFNVAKDELECFAMRDFKANDEVTMFYGPRPNAELFIHSGFVLPTNVENCYDRYAIKLGISSNDSLGNDKNLLCEKLGLPSKGTFYLNVTEEPVDTRLLNFCKISTLDKESLELWLSKSPEEIQSFFKDETQTNKGMDFLRTRLTILLRSYKTSVEDDELLLKDSLTDNRRLAILMRITEKMLLKKALSKLGTS